MHPVCVCMIFSTLYNTLPRNRIKDELVDLTERIIFILHVMTVIFTSDAVKLWSCQKVCEALTFFLDNIYIKFGSKLYRQTVGIPMGTNFAPLVSDLFCTVTRKTSCCLLQMIISLKLLKHSILLLGIWMTY